MNEKPISPEVLAHYGVLGMKWGVRKDNKPQGHQYGKAGEKWRARKRAKGQKVPSKRKTNRMAKKDAAEFTKAKMFYGTGNRRKLIKATVEQRKKQNPHYKDAFDSYVENTDMAKRSSQAVSARKRADVKAATGKTFRGTTNMLRGNPQAASAAIFATFTLGSMAYKAGAFDYVKEHGPTLY